MNINEKVKQYIQLRDFKLGKDKVHKADMKKVADAMEVLEIEILKFFEDTGQESSKTDAGTVFKTTKTQAAVADWDAFWKWCLAGEHFHFLEHRVNKTAVDEYRTANENAIPPGINCAAETTVQFRR